MPPAFGASHLPCCSIEVAAPTRSSTPGARAYPSLQSYLTGKTTVNSDAHVTGTLCRHKAVMTLNGGCARPVGRPLGPAAGHTSFTFAPRLRYKPPLLGRKPHALSAGSKAVRGEPGSHNRGHNR